MRKPSVKTKCPANAYTARDERIVEFSHVDGGTLYGGLISFKAVDGGLLVDVYRLDPGVTVRVAGQP